MDYLNKREMKAMDDLKSSYGGADKISKILEEKRKDSRYFFSRALEKAL